MEKPVVLIKEELKNGLVQLINQTNLPPFIIEPVIFDLLLQVREAANKELAYEKARFAESQNVEEKEATA